MNEEALRVETGIAETVSSEPQATPRNLFALKHVDTFIVADEVGNISGVGDGMFRDDTRVLSRLRLALGNLPPTLLGSALTQDNVFFISNLTNRPLPPLGGDSTPEGVIRIERKRLLWNERLYERISLTNYGDRSFRAPLRIGFAADFRDMFEVRGERRPARGRLLPSKVSDAGVVLRYEGLDRIVRASVIAFSQAPDHLTADQAEFLIHLPSQAKHDLYMEVGPEEADRPGRQRFRDAGAHARVAMRRIIRRSATLRSSGRLFNDWLERSRADLALLTTEMPGGPYPYAGIPWFSTTFGRDAIITALQTLWLNPGLAKGVLNFLSAHQATETSLFQDAAPGKIMHEMRKGEMTGLSELPFGRYYGGADTTPLYVVLAGAYAERTADMAFLDSLWPSLKAAMGWIEEYGDSNHDGFLDYARGSATGLKNQGWKDSIDSVFHADGRQAEGPIALVEIQAYVFRALSVMADLAERRGEVDAALHWRTKAELLREAVEQRFWMDDIGFYGIALDGAGELCRVRASNAGHLLYLGLAAPERARLVAECLLSAPFNSGWGIRTLAQGEVHFNPMSYHNGSVWPHDSALCAAGMARYGEKRGVVRLLGEAFETAVHFDMRLPELFCGFRRSSGVPPIPYPVACLPQAWSSGSIFMILQACLGLQIDGWRSEIVIERPELPIGIDQLSVHGLAVGSARINLAFQRIGGRVVAFPDRAEQQGVRIITRQ